MRLGQRNSDWFHYAEQRHVPIRTRQSYRFTISNHSSCASSAARARRADSHVHARCDKLIDLCQRYGAASVNVTAASKVTPSISGQAPTTSITTAQAFSVTVGVSVALGPAYQTPTGSVTASSGSYSSATTSLSNGTATINVPAGALAVGTDTMNLTTHPTREFCRLYDRFRHSIRDDCVSSSAQLRTQRHLNDFVSGGVNWKLLDDYITPNNGFTGTIELTAALTSSRQAHKTCRHSVSAPRIR